MGLIILNAFYRVFSFQELLVFMVQWKEFGGFAVLHFVFKLVLLVTTSMILGRLLNLRAFVYKMERDRNTLLQS